MIVPISDHGPLSAILTNEEEPIAMVTEAQTAANRRKSTKDTAHAEQAKNRSRHEALEQTCQANLLVLPMEEFGEIEQRSRGLEASFRPRNAMEQILVERLVRLDRMSKYIQNAETARLTSRIYHTTTDESREEEAEVIDLSLRLFRPVHARRAAAGPQGQKESRVTGPESADEVVGKNHPARLIIDLKRTLTGCEWLLAQWNSLRDLLDRELPWLPSDQLKAIRLLGHNPVDALDSDDVAQIYLASHVLLNADGKPFSELLNEIPAERAPAYENCLRLRGYEASMPKDAAEARQFLCEIIDRAVELLEDTAGVLREVGAIDDNIGAFRRSWDDTPEGERLRRYEFGCRRDWHRTIDLLLKMRQKSSNFDLGSISLMRNEHRVLLQPPSLYDRNDFPKPDERASDNAGAVTADAPNEPNSKANAPSEPNSPQKLPNEPNLVKRTAPSEPDSPRNLPSEPKSAKANAPSEPNLPREKPAAGRLENGKEFRIDTPHRDHKPGGIGKSDKERYVPGLERALGGNKGSLLDLSPIFGKA